MGLAYAFDHSLAAPISLGKAAWSCRAVQAREMEAAAGRQEIEAAGYQKAEQRPISLYYVKFLYRKFFHNNGKCLSHPSVTKIIIVPAMPIKSFF